MNRHPCLWFTWLLLAMLVLVPQLPAQTATDLNEGSRLEYDSTNENNFHGISFSSLLLGSVK